MNYIIAIGLFQALLTMMLLLIGRKQRPARSLILGLLVCVFTHLALKFSIYALADYTVLRKGFHTFIGLAYGPVLWMIARKVKEDTYMPARHWYVLLPAMFGAIAYLGIVLYMVSTGREPISAISLYNNLALVLILISGLAYPLAAFLIAGRLDPFRKTEQQLIRNLSVLFLFMGVVAVVTLAFQHFYVPARKEQIAVRIISYSLLLLVCLAILHYLIRSELKANTENGELSLFSGTLPSSFADVKLLQLPAIPALASATEYRVPELQEKEAPLKSALPASQQREIVQQLEELMQTRKYYTDPDIDLDQLSHIARISRHHISEALNQYAHKTFYQFLNEYRIREILQLLDKCKSNNVRPNILSLAFEVGFNSKSSFNLYFKKTTGLTPSEYLRQG